MYTDTVCSIRRPMQTEKHYNNIKCVFTLDKEEVMCGGVGAGVGCWLPRPLLGDGGGAESGDESSEKRVSLPLSMFNTHNLQRCWNVTKTEIFF